MENQKSAPFSIHLQDLPELPDRRRYVVDHFEEGLQFIFGNIFYDGLFKAEYRFQRQFPHFLAVGGKADVYLAFVDLVLGPFDHSPVFQILQAPGKTKAMEMLASYFKAISLYNLEMFSHASLILYMVILSATSSNDSMI